MVSLSDVRGRSCLKRLEEERGERREENGRLGGWETGRRLGVEVGLMMSQGAWRKDGGVISGWQTDANAG